jgi:hypothetical protein
VRSRKSYDQESRAIRGIVRLRKSCEQGDRTIKKVVRSGNRTIEKVVRARGSCDQGSRAIRGVVRLRKSCDQGNRTIRGVVRSGESCDQGNRTIRRVVRSGGLYQHLLTMKKFRSANFLVSAFADRGKILSHQQIPWYQRSMTLELTCFATQTDLWQLYCTRLVTDSTAILKA